MDQIVYLDRNDDVLKLHSKVEWSDGRRVILVAPRGCKALDAEHELRLLRRWAESSDVMVGLVSNDINVREISAEIGLPVFSSLQAAQRTNWNWVPHRSGNGNGYGIAPRPTALDDEVLRPREPVLERLGLAGFQLVLTLVIFGVALFLVASAAILFVPAANITVVPAAIPVSDNSEIYVDPNAATVDAINRVVPGVAIRREISGTGTISTTNTATAPADYATGTVIFTNLAGTPTTIVTGTIAATTSGENVRFATTISTTLSGGFNSRVQVPIRALQPGPSGNVKALQINFIEGPLSAVARVVNPAPTQGGSMKKVHVVSFDDKTRLREKVAEQVRKSAIATMQAEFNDKVYVPPASVEVLVLNETFDHVVDDPSDTLSLHVEAVAKALYVSQSDLEKFAERALLTKMPARSTVLPGTLHVEPDLNSRVEGQSVIMRVRSILYTTPQVDGDQVLRGITGKSRDEAADLIAARLKLAEPPVIRVSPDWWPRMPFFGFRLALFVKPEQPTE